LKVSGNRHRLSAETAARDRGGRRGDEGKDIGNASCGAQRGSSKVFVFGEGPRVNCSVPGQRKWPRRLREGTTPGSAGSWRGFLSPPNRPTPPKSPIILVFSPGNRPPVRSQCSEYGWMRDYGLEGMKGLARLLGLKLQKGISRELHRRFEARGRAWSLARFHCRRVLARLMQPRFRTNYGNRESVRERMRCPERSLFRILGRYRISTGQLDK
jgi:hypothetical protein